MSSGATFSLVDPGLVYGIALKTPHTVVGYRFSSASTTPVFDPAACGSKPPLPPAPHLAIGDLSVSARDDRFAVSAGGNQFGNRVFVIVHDTHLGCRWYNTKTGEVGGQWGATGRAVVPENFLIRHAYISGSGRYVKISADGVGFFVWDVATLNVEACLYHSGLQCGGYGALGKDTYISEGGIDDMNMLQRPLGSLASFFPIINPLPLPHYVGMEHHFTWTNGHLTDAAPICGSTYPPGGNPLVTQPFDDEIFCLETDGLGSTIWRFAHHRAIWDKEYYWTEPFGNVSLDGRFFLFTSGWDGQLGLDADGDPRTDVWIVKLE